MKDLKNTFVRIKNQQHYDAVVRAYRNAGYERASVADPYCHWAKWLSVPLDKKDHITKKHVVFACEHEDEDIRHGIELILKNGELIEKSPDWSKTYVKVNGEREYELAIEAYKKLTGKEVADDEHMYMGNYVGIGKHFGEIVSLDTPKNLKGTEIPLKQLLEAANIKPAIKRTKITYEETGDTVRILKIENVLTKEECERLVPGYISEVAPYYMSARGWLVVSESVKNKCFSFELVGGASVVTKDHFERIVKIMKAADKRFVAIRKAPKSVVKSVEI